MRRKSVVINAHLSLFNEMEKIRNYYKQRSGINLSQVQLTDIISKNIKPLKVNRLDLIGGCNGKKKGRPY